MLVLPEPVMPWRSLVGVSMRFRAVRADFWAELSKIVDIAQVGSIPATVIFSSPSLISDLLLLLRLPRPWGKNSFAAKGNGTR